MVRRGSGGGVICLGDVQATQVREALRHSKRCPFRIGGRMGACDCGVAAALALLVPAGTADPEIDVLLGSARLLVKAADRLASHVARLVRAGRVSSRSEAGDALLDYDSLDDHRASLGLPPSGFFNAHADGRET